MNYIPESNIKSSLEKLIHKILSKVDSNRILIVGTDEQCEKIADAFGKREEFISNENKSISGVKLKYHKIDFHSDSCGCGITIISMPDGIHYGSIYIMPIEGDMSFTYSEKYECALTKEEV